MIGNSLAQVSACLTVLPLSCVSSSSLPYLPLRSEVSLSEMLSVLTLPWKASKRLLRLKMIKLSFLEIH
ncbi:hypothetical protein M0R45_010061 [Rubus argutus]|uniref:Secreted protein n=1 Tax=Rubus argutus TaxID=59490 RepID=A0AAW1Y6N3_RUBAR